MKLSELLEQEKYNKTNDYNHLLSKSYLLCIKGLNYGTPQEYVKSFISPYVEKIEKIYTFSDNIQDCVEINGKNLQLGFGHKIVVLCHFRRNLLFFPKLYFYINNQIVENISIDIIPWNTEANEKLKSNLNDSNEEIRNILHIIRTKKFDTIADKIECLDKIDEIARKNFEKLYPDAKIRPTFGQLACCNNFCPETERLKKISTDQLNIFERIDAYPGMRNNIEEEILIVKDYTRSAADQNIPLPYEIRSIKTLRLLMNHLINNVLNSSLILTPEWFNFLYDCMRSMRKEISQLNIYNEESINILEEMTRFHIFCIPYTSKITNDPTNNDNSLGLQHSFGLLKDFYMNYLKKNSKDNLLNYCEFSSYQVALSLTNQLES
ncbi:hypothetical protein HZS_50, partial [Henneguya salminicola]